MSKKHKSREIKQKCNIDSNWLRDYSKYMITGIFAGILVSVNQHYDLGRFSICSKEYWTGFASQFIILIVLIILGAFFFRGLYQSKEGKKKGRDNSRSNKNKSKGLKDYMKIVIAGVFVGIALGITQSMNLGQYPLLSKEYWIGFVIVIFICTAIISGGWFIFKKLS